MAETMVCIPTVASVGASSKGMGLQQWDIRRLDGMSVDSMIGKQGLGQGAVHLRNNYCITISWPLNGTAEDYITPPKPQEERVELQHWAILHKDAPGNLSKAVTSGTTPTCSGCTDCSSRVDELESEIAVVKWKLEASNQWHEVHDHEMNTLQDHEVDTLQDLVEHLWAHVFKPQDSPSTHLIPALITFNSEDESAAVNPCERTSSGLFTMQGDPPSTLFDMSRPLSPLCSTSILPIIALIPADVDTHTQPLNHA
ncbi:hypothetical protein V8B97DRAFT_1914988 [Scleroderma yunnanense]